MAHENLGAEGHPRADEFGPPSPARRRFLTQITYAVSAVGGAIVGIPIVSFLLGPLLRQPPGDWIPVGRVSEFEVGETVQVAIEDPSPLPWTGIAATTAAWLRRETKAEFIAFSVNCTHLGCPIRWLADASLFMCPCHGGVFYRDGRVAGGPPQEPLRRYPVRVQGDEVQLLNRTVHPPFEEEPDVTVPGDVGT